MPDEAEEQPQEPRERAEPESERMRILRLIQEGKVTPEEGAKLLQSLGRARPAAASTPRIAPGATGAKRWVRIEIADPRGGQVNLRLPLSLVHLLTRFVPEGVTVGEQKLSVEEIVSLVEGGQGEIVSIAGHRGEQVCIRVE